MYAHFSESMLLFLHDIHYHSYTWIIKCKNLSKNVIEFCIYLQEICRNFTTLKTLCVHFAHLHEMLSSAILYSYVQEMACLGKESMQGGLVNNPMMKLEDQSLHDYKSGQLPIRHTMITCTMKALECRTLTTQSQPLICRTPVRGGGGGGGGMVSPTALSKIMYASAAYNVH